MYHVPVLLNESIEGLDIQPDKTYVDVTFGGGGHSSLILQKLQGGKLLGFDQDPDARQNAEQLGDARLKLIEANFRYLKKYLKLYQAPKVDGILADLGISSHQIDQAERGFSIRWDAKLDMRMDQSGSTTARDIVNGYDEKQLAAIFRSFGEVKNAWPLAKGIVRARATSSIETTGELVKVLDKFAPKGKEFKYQAQVFQALRIEVNEEIEVLKEFLEGCAEVLNKGGRLVVISYHSLEDRLVKNFMKHGKFEGEPEKDLYGNLIRPFKPIQNKPITAPPEEISRNNRARSAKLRIAEKI
ncbi:16S rRNA (cytosine(1402)-N(4))-methyltransferase RsmH [Chondrinema litorale]|uniref:16S rRNA (cytosine(1402)-N(4))-methyltransferase RsmH n=1 Tax=Chondrinema litorale TaxID=2994555 RepID=UPI002544BD7C|nr:16S rRNA (cytosine(1402)-N(4))-methyltransferase RsmH [Chondrinema litorale]UZR93257.1 16S rRNA (cytosine(1402)-N(4))-methyltransferase RsmH [Chondrinema litorale]